MWFLAVDENCLRKAFFGSLCLFSKQILLISCLTIIFKHVYVKLNYQNYLQRLTQRVQLIRAKKTRTFVVFWGKKQKQT